MKQVLPLLFVALIGLQGCASEPAAIAPDANLVAQGRAVAARECAGCHALDASRPSPLAAAPPMSELLGRYAPEMLANDLIEGIRVGHDEMPEFDFTVTAADALMAYLQSIRTR
jgi:cytochrome c